jgi:hypothetical protein
MGAIYEGKHKTEIHERGYGVKSKRLKKETNGRDDNTTTDDLLSCTVRDLNTPLISHANDNQHGPLYEKRQSLVDCIIFGDSSMGWLFCTCTIVCKMCLITGKFRETYFL